MLTYGFYNSVNKDRRYDAEQVGALFDGLITDGVFANYKSALKVTPGPGFREIVISPGKAWFNGTWTTVDDEGHRFYLRGSSVDATYYIYLSVNKPDRSNSISGYTSERLSDPNTGLYFYLLAQVTIPGGVNEIDQSMIVDTRGSNQCPYVTGILETVSFEELVKEVCGDNWQEWLAEYSNDIDKKVEGAVEDASTALARADLAHKRLNETTDVTYMWAKYEAVPTGSASYEFESAVEDIGNVAPPQRKLYWGLSFDGTAVTLVNPLHKMPATVQEQLSNWKQYKYFYGDGLDGTTDSTVYRYDELSVKYIGGSANSEGVYTIRTSVAVVNPAPVIAGDYVGTVTSGSPYTYPKDGPSGEYWYTRFAARAEDVFFDGSSLALPAKNVQEAILDLYQNGGTGTGGVVRPSFIEVTSLPNTGATGVIYVVKNPNGSDSDEYIWVDRWEKLGGSGNSGGGSGENGATFTPNLSENGDLSWTNDKGLQNPATVNIKGSKGDNGGYYVPDVTQPSKNKVQFEWSPSKSTMPSVPPIAFEIESDQDLYYNAKSHGVKGDGATDDAPALNALVTLVSDAGGGTIYLPKGVYMLDAPVLWKSNVSLVGAGMGIAVLKTRQAAGVGEGFAAIRGLTFSAEEPYVNCSFEKFTIDGEEMQITEYTSWPKGINIHFLDKCAFRDLEIRNTCATGLGVDHLRSAVIDHVVCINCGRSWSGDGTEQNVGGAGIGIGTNCMEGESLIVQNCVADGCGNYGIFFEKQGYTYPGKAEGHVIANNVVRNGRNHGIVIKGDTNVVVADNVVFGNANDGLAVLENNEFVTEHIVFSGNLVRGNGNGFRLESDGICRDITISGNVFNGNANGIVLNTDTTELSLIGNTIKNSATALTVRGTHADTVIRNNVVYKNTAGEVISGSFTGDTSQNDYIAAVGPDAIAFTEDSYRIIAGGTLPLSIAFTPAGTSGFVTYSVDNATVAKIEGNSLVGLSAGSAVITAICGDLTATAPVTVVAEADLSAYTKLEYIQSSGTQYINTGFNPDNRTRVMARTWNNYALDVLNYAICGTRTASKVKEFDLRCSSQFYWGSSMVETGVSHSGTVDFNKNTLSANGALVGRAPTETFECEYPLYIFALNGAGSALSNTMAAMRLYEMNIFDGGTMVRAFVPVRRKSDNAVGLVDALTGNFYGNSGTGSFTGA